MASRLLDARGRPSQSSASALSHLQGRAATVLNKLMQRAECVATAENPGLCEKPAISSQSTTWIIVGVIIGLLVTVTLSVMLFFHIRKRKRDRQEDMASSNGFTLDDYGLDTGNSVARKPQGQNRLSFDDLPRPGAPPSVARNPFADDSTPNRSVEGLNAPKSWPKRVDSNESSEPSLPPLKL